MGDAPEKPVEWLPSVLKELGGFPAEVRRGIGYALGVAQEGGMPINAKAMKGFGGASVLEIVENYNTDTFRAVYTVRIAKAIYVLHCFQKKSKTGIATDKSDMELIRKRLANAEADYKARYGEQKS